MCIRELFREFVAAKRRMRDEAEARVIHAWHTAVFVGQAWAGKLKSLKEILPRRVSEVQSVAQQTAVFQTISAKYGIEPKRVRLVRKDA